MDGRKKEKFRDDPPYTDIVWTEMTRAIAQVLLGNLMIVGGTLSISYYCELCYVSTGIWVGALVLAAGVLGVVESSRDYYGLTRAYVITLFCTLVLSLTLFSVEIAGFVIDSAGCDKPLFNTTTTVAPPSTTPFSWNTHTTHFPSTGNCVMECVYIHGSLSAFALLDIAAAAVSIYFAYQSVKKLKAGPPPYNAMVAEPIPYKQAI